MIAIDLGSNSIRFLKMNCETKEAMGEFHKTVKTADGLATTGIISDGAVARIIMAINEAKESIEFSDTIIKAVTTEAIRQAQNSDVVLEKIREKTGVSFEIIDGEAEAKYALIAAQNRLKLLGQEPKSFMLADIGGASTEIIFHYGEGQSVSKSFNVGIVTVTETFKTIGAIANAIPILMNPIKIFSNDVYAKYGNVETFIATAGTPTTIAAMKLGMKYETYDASKIHGTVLSRRDLIEKLSALLQMSNKEREGVVGVGREDLIASGVLIYDELYEIGGFTESVVIDDGIREGV
ncbi:MAG: phosphatase, partial [Kiritimatiellae bacterium]|nr:phosphatase [Kiritimatiellia bacterium]